VEVEKGLGRCRQARTVFVDAEKGSVEVSAGSYGTRRCQERVGRGVYWL
jgi:hypothetical protein